MNVLSILPMWQRTKEAICRITCRMIKPTDNQIDVTARYGIEEHAIIKITSFCWLPIFIQSNNHPPDPTATGRQWRNNMTLCDFKNFWRSEVTVPLNQNSSSWKVVPHLATLPGDSVPNLQINSTSSLGWISRVPTFQTLLCKRQLWFAIKVFIWPQQNPPIDGIAPIIDRTTFLTKMVEIKAECFVNLFMGSSGNSSFGTPHFKLLNCFLIRHRCFRLDLSHLQKFVWCNHHWNI